MFDPETIIRTMRAMAGPELDWTLRLVCETGEHLRVRRDIAEPPQLHRRLGAYLCCRDGSGCAYAATSDTSPAGLRQALDIALARTREVEPWLLFAPLAGQAPERSGSYQSPVQQPWNDWPLQDKIGLLAAIQPRLKCHDHIVEWSAGLAHRQIEIWTVGPATEVTQSFSFIMPALRVIASDGQVTQARSYGEDLAAQAGLEYLQPLDLDTAADRIAAEALQLLSAPECPDGQADVLLMPGQMALQIHESIGHPLELDRILGDERNYAGSSFVTPDMFGCYQYGSEQLNVVFDPALPGQLASYAFDDEGNSASREYLIHNGILLRPLGAPLSQQRAGLPGVANARSCNWNRPPIDRMANINMEPGNSTFAELVAGIEHGILMDTNRSWSIDDHRNKFQFGCEYGRLICEGQLQGMVRNPNYRGISATFWRNLKAVGNADTFVVHGVLTCGKGEPNQALHAGHAAPACVFRDVSIFGGD